MLRYIFFLSLIIMEFGYVKLPILKFDINSFKQFVKFMFYQSNLFGKNKNKVKRDLKVI